MVAIHFANTHSRRTDLAIYVGASQWFRAGCHLRIFLVAASNDYSGTLFLQRVYERVAMGCRVANYGR